MPVNTPRLAITDHCELRRRSAVESVIGHLKAEHRMGRTISGCGAVSRQRRPRCRRLRLPPPHPLAQDFVAANPGGSLRPAVDQSGLNSTFFTDDCFDSGRLGLKMRRATRFSLASWRRSTWLLRAGRAIPSSRKIRWQGIQSQRPVPLALGGTADTPIDTPFNLASIVISNHKRDRLSCCYNL